MYHSSTFPVSHSVLQLTAAYDSDLAQLSHRQSTIQASYPPCLSRCSTVSCVICFMSKFCNSETCMLHRWRSLWANRFGSTVRPVFALDIGDIRAYVLIYLCVRSVGSRRWRYCRRSYIWYHLRTCRRRMDIALEWICKTTLQYALHYAC